MDKNHAAARHIQSLYRGYKTRTVIIHRSRRLFETIFRSVVRHHHDGDDDDDGDGGPLPYWKTMNRLCLPRGKPCHEQSRDVVNDSHYHVATCHRSSSSSSSSFTDEEMMELELERLETALKCRLAYLKGGGDGDSGVIASRYG
eukprot:CAMPEP_0172482374 /NCGR_PEP_ID=MMETSP1066-20121228/8732_1 /TAXON_ID=671091 /ORGANISM="Coscinodiscus wailesii, Strain CCMP2513" /LENGTH=143 /DNA_ID=CAMNT_0013245425 /DNA_START=55 /DNA_END=486 /DNA_ORIENTATION=-